MERKEVSLYYVRLRIGVNFMSPLHTIRASKAASAPSYPNRYSCTLYQQNTTYIYLFYLIQDYGMVYRYGTMYKSSVIVATLDAIINLSLHNCTLHNCFSFIATVISGTGLHGCIFMNS
jgi:hypothetical protein